MIVEALARLRPRSCIVDGEAVSCGEDGIASFDRIRHRHYDHSVFLYAFDLIELDGEDLRRDPLHVRKAFRNMRPVELIAAGKEVSSCCRSGSTERAA